MFSCRILTKASFCFVVLVLVLASIVPPANAQGGDDKPLGSVWASVYYGGQPCPPGQICPNVAVQLPGGGQGVISSGIEWWSFRVDGIGRTEVQSTIYTWELSAYTQLYQNHLPVGYAGWNRKWSSGAYDSIEARYSTIRIPYGSYWSNEAKGKIHNPSLMTWEDSVTVGKQL